MAEYIPMALALMNQFSGGGGGGQAPTGQMRYPFGAQGYMPDYTVQALQDYMAQAKPLISQMELSSAFKEALKKSRGSTTQALQDYMAQTRPLISQMELSPALRESLRKKKEQEMQNIYTQMQNEAKQSAIQAGRVPTAWESSAFASTQPEILKQMGQIGSTYDLALQQAEEQSRQARLQAEMGLTEVPYQAAQRDYAYDLALQQLEEQSRQQRLQAELGLTGLPYQAAQQEKQNILGYTGQSEMARTQSELAKWQNEQQRNQNLISTMGYLAGMGVFKPQGQMQPQQQAQSPLLDIRPRQEQQFRSLPRQEQQFRQSVTPFESMPNEMRPQGAYNNYNRQLRRFRPRRML